MDAEIEVRPELGAELEDIRRGLAVSAVISAAVELPKIRISFEDARVTVVLEAPDPEHPLVLKPRVELEPPRGAHALIDLPIVKVGGRLLVQPHGKNTTYLGILAAELPVFSASAIGLVTFEPSFSFAAILAASFPAPGIQVGFGFAVTGVGGIIGVDRGVDREGLLRSVADGSIAGLLFPRGPLTAAKGALEAMAAVFPHRPGTVLVGPMVEISWGGSLVTGAVAVILEISDYPRISLLGKLGLTLPTADQPLIHLEAVFAGQVDPAVPSLTFMASLRGDIVGMPITGDLFVLVRGGREADFVLSGGGFHPRYTPPRGVPTLRRLAMDLSTIPAITLRCEGYLAITSNSVQFGGGVELRAEVAGFGLRGHLQFDVLVQFTPDLYFIAELTASIAVRVAGMNLVGIHLELALEGPTQWRARGSLSIDLFFFEARLAFDETWGTLRPLQSEPPDVAEALRSAFSQPSAWVVRRPPTVPAGLHVSREAEALLGSGKILDPFGSVTARQRVVPLEQPIERFQRVPLGPPGTRERWEITQIGLSGNMAAATTKVKEQFAPGQFLRQTDDEQLSQPAFSEYVAGAELYEARLVMDSRTDKLADIKFETPGLMTETGPEPVELAGETTAGAFDLRGVEAVALATVASHPTWWTPPSGGILVKDTVPSTIASAWSLTVPQMSLAEDRGDPGPAQDLDDPGLILVEAWEVPV